MLFSGFYSEHKCTNCGHTIGRATPTSLLFFLMLAGVGTAVVSPQIARIIEAPWKWWHSVAVGGAELILVLATVSVLDWIHGKIQGSLDTCPRCSGTMTPTVSGMYDFALLPTVLEIVLLVIFVAAHVGIVFWLRGLAG